MYNRKQMDNKFPSSEEQEFVKQYVLERPLCRPSITYKKVALWIVIIISVSIGFSILSHKLLLYVLGFFLPSILYYIIFFLIEFLLLLKPIAITAIRLYQHYAPEKIRRRCLLKPTCSEYAILAIKKYGTLVGTIKTWRRLKYYCRGDVYYIDEP